MDIANQQNSERPKQKNKWKDYLLSIVHCFSSRLYGLRKYSKELKTAILETE
ncbi:Putative transposase [Helicobacter felis]|uniref:Transposase n=1 Tax=Helicobacter felis (strain ATCC 49179 / CCUG 28539 / NCTC 12436 / CS1) TaxID=936155 RepID=E7AC38_HELFC|nr:putative transposase [Helicobacter felis ATCC 49179]